MNTIDSHQHFWVYHKDELSWINKQMIFIKNNYLPEDLQKEMEKTGVNGSIVIQTRKTLEETRWLLKLSRENDFIKGVVGWVDLLSDRVEENIIEFTGLPKFVGVRHAIQDEPNIDFMLRKDFLRGLAYVQDYGLTFDLLVRPQHLKTTAEMVSKLPELKFVLNHLGKPDIKNGTKEPWATDLKSLAKFKNVYCKLSGMVTEADWNKWKPQDFYPYLDVAYESFGPDRLMIGSDWPVCLVAGSYQEVLDIYFEFLSQFPSEARNKITSENCLDFYAIKTRKQNPS